MKVDLTLSKLKLKRHPELFDIAVDIAKKVLEDEEVEMGLCYTFSVHGEKYGVPWPTFYKYFAVLFENPDLQLPEPGKFTDARRYVLETIVAIPPEDMFEVLTS